jgi:hypothetical protein
MDLNIDTINRTLFPTAAFASELKLPDLSRVENSTPSCWEDADLNILSRIDSLTPLQNPKWEIHGCSGFGTQFFTVPIFLSNLIPMRIDTFIPSPTTLSPELVHTLEIDKAFHIKDSRVALLAISQHILRSLEIWTQCFPDFAGFYNRLPFGSRILFQNLSKNIRNIRIQVVQTHNLEKQFLSVDSLHSLWTAIPASSWPPTLELSQTRFIRQLHDSTCLIQLPDGNTVVMKALTSSPKYLYHELRTLLTLPHHPNIIPPPLHLITKRCSFGSKHCVLGFTTSYQPNLTLQDSLPLLSQSLLTPAVQLKWSLQITSALMHIREQGKSFYSDLRAENIVLSSTMDLVLLDFEQRGVWSHFAPPEISYLEYITDLAFSSLLPTTTHDKFKELYETYMGATAPQQAEQYRNPERG